MDCAIIIPSTKALNEVARRKVRYKGLADNASIKAMDLHDSLIITL